MNPNNASARPSSSAVIVERELSYLIVQAFLEAYRELGYGFLESPYARALEIALRKRGLSVEREHEVLLFFQGEQIGKHRLDLVVERRVVIEVKSTERIGEGARRQLRSYLAATGIELGILLHFGPRPAFYRVLGPRPLKVDTT